MMVWFHLLVEMLEILLEVFDVVASCWTSHNDLDVQVDKPSEHRTHYESLQTLDQTPYQGLVLAGENRIAFLVGQEH